MPASVTWKHPHVRGEDKRGGFKSCPFLETPPRAWGRPVSNTAIIALTGNTPTCVGKTYIDIDLLPEIEKHPHVRGEDTERLFTFFIEPSKQY